MARQAFEAAGKGYEFFAWQQPVFVASNVNAAVRIGLGKVSVTTNAGLVLHPVPRLMTSRAAIAQLGMSLDERARLIAAPSTEHRCEDQNDDTPAG
jgi:hypothetical protein